MLEFDLLMELRLVDCLYTCRLWLSLVDIFCHNVTSNPTLQGKMPERIAVGQSRASFIRNAQRSGHEAPHGGTIRWPSVSRHDISPREPSVQTNNSQHPSSPRLAEAWDGPEMAVRPLCSALMNYRRGNDPSATTVNQRPSVVAPPCGPKTGR